MWNPFALADDISAGLGREENWRITSHDARSTDFIMQRMFWDGGYVLLGNTVTLISLAVFALVKHYNNV